MMPPTAHCQYAETGFRATAVRSCGSRLIRVAGAAIAPSSGWTLDLAAANPGVVAHPDSLWLVLTEHPPVVDARSRAGTPVPVEAIIEDSEATEIVVRFDWRDPIAVPVLEYPTTLPTQRGASLAAR